MKTTGIINSNINMTSILDNFVFIMKFWVYIEINKYLEHGWNEPQTG